MDQNVLNVRNAGNRSRVHKTRSERYLREQFSYLLNERLSCYQCNYEQQENQSFILIEKGLLSLKNEDEICQNLSNCSVRISPVVVCPLGPGK